MIDIVLIVLPVFLIIALGFSLKGTGLLNDNFIVQLNRLVYYVALPALFFYKIGTADFSASFNPKLILGIIISVTLIGCFTYLYGVLRNYPPAALGAVCQGSFRGNLVYVGLAIIINAYGEEGLAIGSILTGLMTPIVNVLSIAVLLLPLRQSDNKLGPRFWLYQIGLNPIILSSFLGIIWSFFALPFPEVFARSFDILTGMSLPLALIVIGASFSPEKLKGEMVMAVFSTVIKIVLLPMLAAIILIALGVGGKELAVGILLAGTPSASAGYILAQQLKSDAELAGSIIMLSTLLSIASFTLILYALKVSGI